MIVYCRCGRRMVVRNKPGLAGVTLVVCPICDGEAASDHLVRPRPRRKG